MTTEELIAVFEEENDEFLKFSRVKERRSNCADLHAFLLLDSLCPDDRCRDIVCGAEHDEIFLRPEPEELAAVATREILIDLIRCGVRYSSDCGLCMFA
jgi:hypothetical protein